MKQTLFLNYQIKKTNSPLIIVIIFLINLSLLSFVSPQINTLGRGLRTTIPALLLSGVLILIVNKHVFINAVIRFRHVLLFGSLFVFQAAFRFALADTDISAWNRYVVGPTLALVLLLWIAALTELRNGAIARLKFWFLTTWSLSLALGIPALFNNPGVTRLTMGNDFAIQNSLIWAPLGVGEYTVYSAFAICVGPLFAIAEQHIGAKRWFGIAAVISAMVAVLLSTFSMAATLMVAGFLATMVVGVITSNKITRKVRLVLTVGLFSLMPTLFVLSNTWEQTDFVTKKITNLVLGVSQTGLAQGDESERGNWFVDEIEAFGKRPLMGYSPGNTSRVEHGHSSLSNSLVLFGFLGSMLWFGAIWIAFRTIRTGLDKAIDRHALLISALLFLVAGVLNPSWHSPTILMALFTLIIPERRVLSNRI